MKYKLAIQSAVTYRNIGYICRYYLNGNNEIDFEYHYSAKGYMFNSLMDIRSYKKYFDNAYQNWKSTQHTIFVIERYEQ